MRISRMNGFTLIELIVVIAIIGVLAAILVPSMLGYVGDSKYSTANSNAKLAYTNTATWCTRCDVNGMSPADIPNGAVINLTTAGAQNPVYNGSSTDLTAALIDLMGGTPRSGEAKVSIEHAAPSNVKWRTGTNDTYVGQYPVAASKASPVTW